LGEIGSIDAVNYAFGFELGKGVTSANRLSAMREWGDIKSKYTWPISRLDTNGAFQEALQILKVAEVDTDAMNRDADSISITASINPSKVDFTPVYWLAWKKKATSGISSLSTDNRIASFVFLEPTKTIHQFHIFDPKYILRKPFNSPDFMALLTTDPTNNPPEFVLREIKAGTNAQTRGDISREYGASESDVRNLGLTPTDAPAGTNTPPQN
jgi:hypothetical protein